MELQPSLSRGAVVLCGGGSTRMGQDKAWLPFGGEPMLARVVRILGEAIPVQNVVVAAGGDQALPELPAGVRIIRDRDADQGPLPAIIAGLYELLRAGVDTAYVTACDAPLLQTAFVERLFSQLTSVEAVDEPVCEGVVPADSARLYPMAGVYTAQCCAGLSAAMEFNAAANNRNSVQAALRAGFIRLKEVPVEELRDVDPDLDSLRNCNTPAEYQAALARAGHLAS